MIERCFLAIEMIDHLTQHIDRIHLIAKDKNSDPSILEGMLLARAAAKAARQHLSGEYYDIIDFREVYWDVLLCSKVEIESD